MDAQPRPIKCLQSRRFLLAKGQGSSFERKFGLALAIIYWVGVGLIRAVSLPILLSLPFSFLNYLHNDYVYVFAGLLLLASYGAHRYFVRNKVSNRRLFELASLNRQAKKNPGGLAELVSRINAKTFIELIALAPRGYWRDATQRDSSALLLLFSWMVVILLFWSNPDIKTFSKDYGLFVLSVALSLFDVIFQGFFGAFDLSINNTVDTSTPLDILLVAYLKISIVLFFSRQLSNQYEYWSGGEFWFQGNYTGLHRFYDTYFEFHSKWIGSVRFYDFGEDSQFGKVPSRELDLEELSREEAAEYEDVLHCSSTHTVEDFELEPESKGSDTDTDVDVRIYHYQLFYKHGYVYMARFGDSDAIAIYYDSPLDMSDICQLRYFPDSSKLALVTVAGVEYDLGIKVHYPRSILFSCYHQVLFIQLNTREFHAQDFTTFPDCVKYFQKVNKFPIVVAKSEHGDLAEEAGRFVPIMKQYMHEKTSPFSIYQSFVDDHDENGMIDMQSAKAPGIKGVLFQPDEFDIYCDGNAGKVYIFHSGNIRHHIVDHIEYHTEARWVALVMDNGDRWDLGAPIRWLVKPLWAAAETVYIVRTENGKTIDGIEVPKINIPIDGDDKVKRTTQKEESH